MDIQISSNLERYLFDIFNRSGIKTAENLESFRAHGKLKVSRNNLLRIQEIFEAYKLDDRGTLRNIKKVYDNTGRVIDPHSSIGFYSATQANKSSSVPIVTLATADPSKFPQAVEKAMNIKTRLPKNLLSSFRRKERYNVLPNDFALVKDYISNQSSTRK